MHSYNYFILLRQWPLHHYVIIFSVLLQLWVWVYLAWQRCGCPPTLGFDFAQYVFSHPFPWSLCVSSKPQWVSQGQTVIWSHASKPIRALYAFWLKNSVLSHFKQLINKDLLMSSYSLLSDAHSFLLLTFSLGALPCERMIFHRATPWFSSLSPVHLL